MMRDILKILEAVAAYDTSEDDRMAEVYDRERKITAMLVQVCQEAGIDLAIRRPVMYDEEDNRAAIISVEGNVTLEQLEKLKPHGSNFVISPNSNGVTYGVQIEFNVSPELG